MDRWLLIITIVLAGCGSVRGALEVHRRQPSSRWTLVLLGAALVCQSVFLGQRGQARGICPLADTGEILIFLSWSLTLFYLVVGSTYRISLLGVFTAPVVVVFQVIALLPGVLEAAPHKSTAGNPWHEMHAATSVMAYGALALAAIAGMMFLVLDRQLKDHHLQSGLFRSLPPIRTLLVSLERLLWLGGGLLTVGVLAGLLMPHGKGVLGHMALALTVWMAYAVLLLVKSVRGLTGRRLSLLVVGLFLGSLGVFAFV